MSTYYRSERATWTSGFGDTCNVLNVYAADQRIAQYQVHADGSCERLMAMGPVYMRSQCDYPTTDTASAAAIAAHKEWEADPGDYREARGVLKGEGIA